MRGAHDRHADSFERRHRPTRLAMLPDRRHEGFLVFYWKVRTALIETGRMPCHHNLEAYLYDYIERCGLAADPAGPLFPTISRSTRKFSKTPLPQANAYQMVRRRAMAARIATRIGNHSFRATGITTYLRNGGTLEKAAVMANHASIRTTQLYDRRRFAVSLDEVERVAI